MISFGDPSYPITTSINPITVNSYTLGYVNYNYQSRFEIFRNSYNHTESVRLMENLKYNSTKLFNDVDFLITKVYKKEIADHLVETFHLGVFTLRFDEAIDNITMKIWNYLVRDGLDTFMADALIAYLVTFEFDTEFAQSTTTPRNSFSYDYTSNSIVPHQEYQIVVGSNCFPKMIVKNLNFSLRALNVTARPVQFKNEIVERIYNKMYSDRQVKNQQFAQAQNESGKWNSIGDKITYEYNPSYGINYTLGGTTNNINCKEFNTCETKKDTWTFYQK